MPREAYFNFTRLCSKLFYIMMQVGREGGGWGGGGGTGCWVMFGYNAFWYLVLLFALLAAVTEKMKMIFANFRQVHPFSNHLTDLKY